jgi:hypothetical protein
MAEEYPIPSTLDPLPQMTAFVPAHGHVLSFAPQLYGEFAFAMNILERQDDRS